MRGQVRAWRPGEVIADLYTVLDEVHSGGMGVVHRVRHNEWDVDLAVKTPRPELFHSEKGRQRFTAEAGNWVDLGLHPHTVNCSYVRTLDHVPRVFAEWVDGGSLADAIGDGRLYEGGPDAALHRILDVAVQTAWGLGHAHESGLIHQDVKPSNVMLEPDWTAKVTDFGLAGARAAAGEGSTTTGPEDGGVSFAGMTAAYCSPEQARAAAGERSVRLTRATDTWSWAVTVLEMFAGHRTTRYGQAAAEALESFLGAGSSDARLPPMPAPVRELLRRCLASDPEDRAAPFASGASAVISAYTESVGSPFPHPAPKPARSADTLSNHALSLLDLGRAEEAESLWRQALGTDPHHGPSVYNNGLHLWRTGQQSDEEVVSALEAARTARGDDWRDSYLLGLVQLERHDDDRAGELLREAAGRAPDSGDVAAALAELDRRPRLRPSAELIGHTEDVTAIALSDDGAHAVSGCEGGALRWWESRTGQCLRTLSRRGAAVIAVAVDHAGRTCLSARRDGSLEAWDLRRGRRTRRLTGSGGTAATAVAVSGDGTIAASGYGNGRVRVWDLATGRVRMSVGHPGKVTDLALSRDGSLVTSASSGRRIRSVGAWDTASCSSVSSLIDSRTLDGPHPDHVFVSPDARTAGLVLNEDRGQGRFVLWDVLAERAVSEVAHRLRHEDVFALGPGGTVAFTGGERMPNRLWETGTGRCLRTLHARSAHRLAPSVTAAIISADGRVAALATHRSVHILGLPTPGYRAPWCYTRPRAAKEVARTDDVFGAALERGQRLLVEHRYEEAAAELRTARAVPGFAREPALLAAWAHAGRHGRRTGLLGAWPTYGLQGRGSFTQPVSLAISTHGRWLATGHWSGEIVVQDASTGEFLHQYPRVRTSARSIHFVDGDHKILVHQRDGTVRVLDTRTGTSHGYFDGDPGRVTALALSPDRDQVLVGHDTGTVRVWNLSDLRRTDALDVCRGPINSVALSADGRHAVANAFLERNPQTSKDECAISLWQRESGKVLWTRGSRDAGDLAYFLADGRTLCVTGFPLVAAWDVSEGTDLYSVQPRFLLDTTGGRMQPPTVALSTDGRLGVVSDSQGRLLVWRTDTGQVVRTLRRGHLQYDCFALTCEGRFLVTSGERDSVCVWDLRSGEPLRVLRGHEAGISALALSSDGTRVATGDLSSVVLGWELDWDFAFTPAAEHWIDERSAQVDGDAGTGRRRRRWFRRG